MIKTLARVILWLSAVSLCVWAVWTGFQVGWRNPWFILWLYIGKTFLILAIGSQWEWKGIGVGLMIDFITDWIMIALSFLGYYNYIIG